MGGGERYAGKLAELLTDSGWSTDLIGHEHVNPRELSAHLDLDLSRARMRVEPDRGEEALVEISSEYDLFITATYMSRLAPRARRNVYVCFFPTPYDHDLPGWARFGVRAVAPLFRDIPREVAYPRGWHQRERSGRKAWIWTQGHGVVALSPGPRRTVNLQLTRFGGPPVELTVKDDAGTELARLTVGAALERFALEVPPMPRGGELHLDSPTFVPSEADRRLLGVALSRFRVTGGRGWRQKIVQRLPWFALDPRGLSFLDSYDAVLAISEYTARWIRKLWRRDAEVLVPPVDLEGLKPGRQRQRAIVSVGRFFDPSHGHSKRQLEMVSAFRSCVSSGALEGWELHLVGGCQPAQEPYLNSVRRAANGLPIHIHANAPRSHVREVLTTASIFWSATGLGENERRRPWTMEHFGITTVEAMAAGCVPVVIDKGGQREIVRDGVDGFRWTRPSELVARTIQVTQDEYLRQRLAAAAIARAEAFSDRAFASRWREIAACLELNGN
jgi:glycosyltransferase involved in cell wall biosynthesis